MISKESLSEVLGCDCSECYFEDTYNLINYKYQYDVTWSEEIQYDNSSINIYELSHKCKEWIRKQGYALTVTHVEYQGIVYAELVDYSSDIPKIIDDIFKADTEPEAIFKACQWILENKEI